jgi:hypothetical protein
MSDLRDCFRVRLDSRPKSLHASIGQMHYWFMDTSYLDVPGALACIRPKEWFGRMHIEPVDRDFRITQKVKLN